MFGLQAACTATVPLNGCIIQANGHLSAPKSWFVDDFLFLHLPHPLVSGPQSSSVSGFKKRWAHPSSTFFVVIVITGEEFVTEQKSRSDN